MTTILEYINNKTQGFDNVKFVAGSYEIRITKASDGNVTAMHNVLGNWTNIPLSSDIDVHSHLSDGSMIHVKVVDSTTGSTIVLFDNKPQLILA